MEKKQEYVYTCKDGFEFPPIMMEKYKALDNGIRIWMDWCGRNIVYEYEFRGHGNPEYTVDGDSVDYEKLPDIFSPEVDGEDWEIDAAIGLASANFTPNIKTLYGET